MHIGAALKAQDLQQLLRQHGASTQQHKHYCSGCTHRRVERCCRTQQQHIFCGLQQCNALLAVGAPCCGHPGGPHAGHAVTMMG